MGREAEETTERSACLYKILDVWYRLADRLLQWWGSSCILHIKSSFPFVLSKSYSSE